MHQHCDQSPGVGATAARRVVGRALLLDLNRFAHPRVARSVWQVVSTAALLVALLVAARLAPAAARLLAVPLIGACLTRVFVLQHDLGHHSLFRSPRVNDALGTLASFVTGVAYEPWRHEHAWHHNHQAQLAVRGVDRVNSPMTVDEGRADRAGASTRRRLIRPWTVALLGIFSLLVKRKRLAGFFFLRPGFPGRPGDLKALGRGLRVSNLGHLAVHALYVAALGAGFWASVVVPATLLGACGGALLFWVQHNFERTHHAGADAWRFVDAGLCGSSYLRLPRALAWFSADIGVHHVHHLNPRVPNYRLEEARQTVPALAAVAPLSRDDLRRCFTHVFWDPARGRMVTFDEMMLG